MSQPSENESILERVDRRVAQVEAALIIIVLTVMISLSALNLILHKLFESGFDWADVVVRQMVLWLGFIGGALATYEGRHIAIDAVGKFLSPQRAAAIRVVTSIAALAITLVMVRAAWTFLSDEMESGSKVFGEIPAWPFEAIIPVGLALISFHFFVAVFRNIQVARGLRAPPTEGEDLDHQHGDVEAGS